MDINKAVSAYLQIRRKIDLLEKDHKAKVKELKDAQDKLQKWLGKQFDTLGVDNVKTDLGTAFRASKDSVRVGNKAEFLEFIVKQVQENGVDGLYLMSATAAKNAVKDWMEEHDDELPPGIKYDSWTEVQVRSK